VKATGKQWFWTYSYPDNGKFEFDSVMIRDVTKLRADQPRLLGVDNEMVVPVNKTVRVITTGAEVIHAFAVPSFGVKIDSVPRPNQRDLVSKATREGIYYGQCSELCGKDHSAMPIAVRVVSEQAFATWVEEAKRKWARDDSAPTNFAAADPATRLTARGHNDTLEGTDHGYILPRRQRPRPLHEAQHDHPTGWRRFVYSTNQRTSARCT